MNALKADPKSVDLRAQASHFYALGARVLELFEDEDVINTLTDVGRSLMDSAGLFCANVTADISKSCSTNS